jgi:hypothetical protein
MDEQTLKVLARLTQVGQIWPMGAWIWNNGGTMSQKRWYKCKCTNWVRYDCELSEAEANQLGIRKENGPIIELDEGS